ncbi:hypothetical protein ACIA8K_29790 [Catenuloplanes sp. NPDC051500]|uniref:hypothetical protein n=1 Tax=Catenuloplanes sp. NPDC051500 TaxID=3363959 RepID=UPI0037A38BD1
MSGADEIVYDEFPEAIRRIHAALRDLETVAEAVPLALALLEHGWTSGSQGTPEGLAWDRLGVSASILVGMLFPDQQRYALMVTGRADDPDLVVAGRELALAAADGLDFLSGEPGTSDERRRSLRKAAANLRSLAEPL